MNKKEVLEIRRQFSPENCAITRICGCYVDHEKEKKMEMKKAFLSLPEEEAFKYFDIFKPVSYTHLDVYKRQFLMLESAQDRTL